MHGALGGKRGLHQEGTTDPQAPWLCHSSVATMRPPPLPGGDGEARGGAVITPPSALPAGVPTLQAPL